MSISYDPMTGEPIETPDVPESAETAAAEVQSEAAKVVENTVETEATEVQSAGSYVQDASQPAAGAYTAPDAQPAAGAYTAPDAPYTASYTQNNAQQNTAGPIPTPVGFDPNTGAPLGGPAQQSGYQAPPKKNKKKIDPKIFIFGGIGLVVILGVILLLSTVGLSKRAKVEKAVVKTMKMDSQLYKDGKNLYNILTGKNYTVSLSADVGTMGSGSGSVVVNGKEKQIAATVDVQGVPEISVLAGIDSKTVKAEAPEITDYLFVYDYTAEKDGYISKMASDEDIEAIDAACKALYDYSGGSDEYTLKLAKLTRKYEKKLEWSKAEAKNFKVNDKKVKCKGYTTTIDKDFVIDYWDEFTDLTLDEYSDIDNDLKKIAGESMKDSLKEVRDELKAMKDTDITCYIYRGALAAVVVDAGKNGSFEVKFKGGDFRAQNIVVEADGEEVLEIKGSKSKDKETYTIAAGRDEMELTYNKKKGTLKLEVGKEELEVNIKSSGGSFVVSADDMDIEGMEVDFTLDVSNSAKIQKYSNTKEFNLGTADEDDFEELTESVDTSLLQKLSMFF